MQLTENVNIIVMQLTENEIKISQRDNILKKRYKYPASEEGNTISFWFFLIELEYLSTRTWQCVRWDRNQNREILGR